MPADFDGDGKADIAVYRRDTGEWFIHQSTDLSLVQILWGAPFLHDVPVPADYDRDGKADIAVYRQDTGQWFIHQSTDLSLVQIPWGAPFFNDLPVELGVAATQ